MEFFDLIFLAIGSAVLKCINLVFKTKIHFGDGGKVVTGIVFSVVMAVLVLLIPSLLRKI